MPEPARTDSYTNGYASVMRQDFSVSPSQDVVVLSGSGMMRLTFNEPPAMPLLKEITELWKTVSDRAHESNTPPFQLGDRKFYISIGDTYCPNQTAEAVASELESRYGLKTLRKKKPLSEYDKKSEPKVVKTFSRGDGFTAGYDSVMKRDGQSAYRIDDSKRIQKVLDWHGLKLGLQYLPGDRRHGRRLKSAYGHVRGTYGMADDGMALDVWVNLDDPKSRRVFRLQQLTDDGEHDEYKYILGARTREQARFIYTMNMPAHLAGKVQRVNLVKLMPQRDDSFSHGYQSVMAA